MELRYYLLDPTKNMTILVETPVPPESQPFLASALLHAEPTAEQVGFLSADNADCALTLRMAGGEFCGNATMSAAALYCLQNGIDAGTVRVRSSGAGSAPLSVHVKKEGQGYSCTIEMPRPKRIIEVFGCPLVEFDGISHLIITDPMARSDAEAKIKQHCHDLGADGLGYMLMNASEETLTPLVYVASPETLFWESSCASGSAAVGAYLAAQHGSAVDLRLREPGGVLRVTASPDGAIALCGTVILRKTEKTDTSALGIPSDI